MPRCKKLIKKLKNKAAFTLMEIVVILTIVGIVAAVAVPSMIGFIEHGKQINRMSIARTIYLAAQNQLTEKRITRNLANFVWNSHNENPIYDFSSGSYILYDDAVLEGRPSNVSTLLGLGFPDADKDNKPFVHFISKERGVPDTDKCPVSRLLSPVIMDPEILNDAILIEYNVKTGVVLSVFYSDVADELGYGTSLDERERVDIDNPSLERPARPYLEAQDRRQGYYGVDETSNLPAEFKDRVQIRVVDGASEPLEIGPISHENVLYANILIPKQLLDNGQKYSFSFGGNSIPVKFPDGPPDPGTMLDTKLMSTPGNDPVIYKIDSKDITPIDVPDEFYGFIWIIDYVGRDMTSNTFKKHSFGFKYPTGLTADRNMTVSLVNEVGVDVAQSNLFNPFYVLNPDNSTYRDSIHIRSARHFYNVRYHTAGRFKQDNDITFNPAVYSVEPIPSFSGVYSGEGHAVIKLNVAGGGIFEEITGRVELLTVMNPTVTLMASTGNVGVITGTNRGSISDIVIISDDSKSPVSGGSVRGGVAGVNDKFVVDGAPVRDGRITRVLYLAVAPHDERDDDESSDESGNIYPITGINNGTIHDPSVIYLSGSEIRPTGILPTEIHNEMYNPSDSVETVVTGTGIGTPKSTEEIYAMGVGSGSPFGGGDWLMNGGYVNVNNLLDKDETNQYQYPYPFLRHPYPSTTSQYIFNFEWPIAEGGVSLQYFEVYQDGTVGFYYLDGVGEDNIIDSLKDELENGEPAIVIDDGYFIVANNNVNLTFGSGAVEPPYIPDELILGWDDGKITIPSAARISDRVMASSDNDNEIVSTSTTPIRISGGGLPRDLFFNPLFAKQIFIGADTGIQSDIEIRSPRQLANITSANITTPTIYRQTLDIDFLWYEGFIDDYAIASTRRNPTTREFISAAVVNGNFSQHSTYDGIRYDKDDNQIDGQITGVRVNASVDNSANTGLFAINYGTIRNITLVNPDISGSGNVGYVGSVAGVNGNSGNITSVYVKYDVNNRAISGTESSTVAVGGIVGRNNGTVTNATFISPFPIVHVEGGSAATTGGIVGQNNGTMRNVQFLSLAPKFEMSGIDRINPIAGNSTSTGTQENAFYLAGTRIRPGLNPGDNNPFGNLPANRNEYNLEPQNAGYGLGLGTDILHGILYGSSSMGPDDALCLDNGIYPYSHLDGQRVADYPDWPIAEGIIIAGGVLYYELYQDGEMRHAINQEIMFGWQSLRDDVVYHDGYALEIVDYNPAPNAEYTLHLGGRSYKITGLDGVNDATVTAAIPDTPALTPPLASWPTTYLAAGDDIGPRARVFIPNDIIESAYVNNSGPITIHLQNTTVPGNTPTIFEVKNINPMFAPSDSEIAIGRIRSPRHISNIYRVSLSDPSYTQRLTVDFEVYRRDITASGDGTGRAIAITGDDRMQVNAAVVPGTFSGSFDGNGREIRNLLIPTTPNATANIDSVGLFANSTGMIQNVTLVNVNIAGQNYVGGIAGTAATIRNCHLKDVIITGQNYVGGIAGTAATITDSNVEAADITGSEYVGGIAGMVTTATNCRVETTDITGSDDYVGGISGTVTTATNCRVETASITGRNNVGGISGTAATATNCQIETASITGRTNVGGITGNATGAVSNCTVTAAAIRSNATNAAYELDARIGGIAGNAGGNISGCNVIDSFIGATTDDARINYIGGIVGHAGGTVENSRITASDAAYPNRIIGYSYVGGIAGNATQSITTCTVTNAIILSNHAANTGDAINARIGGVAGNTSSNIYTCDVINVTVGIENNARITNVGGIVGVTSGNVTNSRVTSTRTGTNDVVLPNRITGYNNVGGVAGSSTSSTASITATGVEHSAVRGTNESAFSVGGIAGTSSGRIEDVYFLSTARLNELAVSHNGGGIVGVNNNGTIRRAFYLAPAPSSSTGEEVSEDGTITTLITIYPIVRSGNGTLQHNYFLAGNRYSVNEGKEENWINERYNYPGSFRIDGQSYRVRLPENQLSTQVRGMPTKFLYLEWLAEAHSVGALKGGLWHQPGGRDPFPYPAIVYPRDFERPVPVRWPEADSPARPDQVDRASDGWDESIPPTARPLAPAFVNGGFTDAFTPAAESGTNVPVSEWISNQNSSRDWVTVDMDSVPGWLTRPVPSRYSLFNVVDPRYYFPFDYGQEGATVAYNQPTANVTVYFYDTRWNSTIPGVPWTSVRMFTGTTGNIATTLHVPPGTSLGNGWWSFTVPGTYAGNGTIRFANGEGTLNPTTAASSVGQWTNSITRPPTATRDQVYYAGNFATVDNSPAPVTSSAVRTNINFFSAQSATVYFYDTRWNSTTPGVPWTNVRMFTGTGTAAATTLRTVEEVNAKNLGNGWWSLTVPGDYAGGTIRFANGEGTLNPTAAAISVGQWTSSITRPTTDNRTRVYYVGNFAGNTTSPDPVSYPDAIVASNANFPNAGFVPFPTPWRVPGSVVRWRLIEFLEPSGLGNQTMPTNYLGQANTTTASRHVRTSPYRFAELNAQHEGTLYQVLSTTPGAEFFYSFYHASRLQDGANPSPANDRMSFYLSPISDEAPVIVTNIDEAKRRDEALVMIRPCISPRTNTSTSVTNRNPNVWNSVAYGSNIATANPYDLSYHRGKDYIQPNGREARQAIPAGIDATNQYYLYDVWVATSPSPTTNTATVYFYDTRWDSPQPQQRWNEVYALTGTTTAAINTGTGVLGTPMGNGWWAFTVPDNQQYIRFSRNSSFIAGTDNTLRTIALNRGATVATRRSDIYFFGNRVGSGTTGVSYATALTSPNFNNLVYFYDTRWNPNTPGAAWNRVFIFRGTTITGGIEGTPEGNGWWSFTITPNSTGGAGTDNSIRFGSNDSIVTTSNTANNVTQTERMANTAGSNYFFGNGVNSTATGYTNAAAYANANFPNSGIPIPAAIPVPSQGYGITFWSTANLSIGAIGNNTIPLAGITQTQLDARAFTWLTAANQNVIGYWGVSHGWKHYYGVYQVPKEQQQERTEFAFQSNTPNPETGNFLDGVSFKSGAFLTINNFIRDKDQEVKFVKPGDVLTVELQVESWGEIAADRIEITDRIAPFNRYIGYVEGSVTVSMERSGGSPLPYSDFREHYDEDEGTLKITLNPNTRMEVGDKLKVTYSIRVFRNLWEGEPSENPSTLLYYFKHQGVVEYSQDSVRNNFRIDMYKDVRQKNGSGVAQIFIDPIKLDKTVTMASNPLATPIDGPFTVTLTVENNLEASRRDSIDTQGLINDLLPRGFGLMNGNKITRSVNDGEAKDMIEGTDYTVTPTLDGSFRITIRDVDLGAKENQEPIYKIKYEYTMAYMKNTAQNYAQGYGVTFAHIAADYRYLYVEFDELNAPIGEPLDAILSFPKPVVGIKVEAREDTFTVGGGLTQLNITANDNFTIRYTDDGYDVTPVVRLHHTDQSLVSIQENNYVINHPDYTAVLDRATNRIAFTPRQGVRGTIEFSYQIMLTATKRGADHEEFELSSALTKVTVHVLPDTLVYYEKYDDGNGIHSYGVYAAGDVFMPPSVPRLSETKPILESGYGTISILPREAEGRVLLDSLGPVYLYKFNPPPAGESDMQPVSVGNTDFHYHPLFAKAMFASGTVADSFYIRTPEQMRNIGLIADTNGKTFIQGRHLDFEDTDLDDEDAVVTGTFGGIFNGGGFEITNVTINTADDDVGLFSKNNGTITGVVLRSADINGKDNVGGISGVNLVNAIISDCIVRESRIEGNNNVGGIAGINRPDATISNCTVEGRTDGSGMHIEGSGNNVGGIAGLNEGDIENCTVQNTTSTIKGSNYVGGIAGFNESGAKITGATTVDNVRILAQGSDIGKIAGKNEGIVDLAENCAKCDSDEECKCGVIFCECEYEEACDENCECDCHDSEPDIDISGTLETLPIIGGLAVYFTIKK
jgi:type II secretory pathway pseudopilin PulG